MAVPDFQTWFLPLLRRVADEENHRLSDLYEQLADDLKLSEADRNEELPSGKQLTYRNRIGWARTYLKKAGLLESPARGECRITQRGLQVLASKPERLNVKFLKQFPEFKEFHTYKKPASETGEQDEDEVSTITPEELLEKSHGALKENVTQELLDRVKGAPPAFFESLVVELLLRMGYGGSREDAGKTVGRSGDGGVDGVINEDRLGLDVVYIQAKRWENTVGRPVVQAFAGSLEGVRARKGVLLTTSSFSAEARQYVSRIEKRIVLVDGEQLANLMFEHNLGVSPVASYEVKKIDSDFFEES
ncbi:restriction endonuclease [bacterium]|nr:restriction endonuclease [bacterium]